MADFIFDIIMTLIFTLGLYLPGKFLVGLPFGFVQYVGMVAMFFVILSIIVITIKKYKEWYYEVF